MTIGKELRMLAPQWVRGRTRYEDGWILIDEPQEYWVYDEKELVFALASISNPDDAIEFASRYGLLRSGPGSDTYRELFSEWETVIARLRDILTGYVTLRGALQGDKDAVEALWVLEPYIRSMFEVKASNDLELFSQVSVYVATGISEGLRGVDQGILATVQFEGGRAGEFALGIYPETLTGVAYHELSMLIVNQKPVRKCIECGQAFLVKDQRQQYCGMSCSNRARYKRWSAKKETH